MIPRLAILSVHTSPLAPMGGKKTGGMNVYIRELAQELGQRGIGVDIFTRRSSVDEPAIDTSIGANVRVVYLTAGPVRPMNPDELYPHLSEFTSRLMAFAMLQNVQYPIIYSHYWLSGWVGQKLKEAWGTPFVQMFHTLGYMKQRIQSHAHIHPDQRITTERDIMAWADRIISATPAEQAQLLWLYQARKRKISIVPPGVNLERFYPLPKQEAKQAIGVPDECRLLLFVGRIEPLKAVDTIIQALSELRRQGQALDCVMFGVVGGNPADNTDTEMVRLQTLTHELGLSDVVCFMGAKGQELLPMYYRAAEVVIMPSDYESFGMVALEAMACGTPVIASEVGGLAYLVQDGITGYLVPTREPHIMAARIQTLLNEPLTGQEMGRNASHLALSYGWPVIADALLQVFDEILGHRAGSKAS